MISHKLLINYSYLTIDLLMKENDITLYNYATSPYGRKILAALKYKGVKFDQVYVNPISTKEIKFTRQRIIPILSIGEAWKVDSNQQAFWLDELFPQNPLFGEKTEDKKAIQDLVHWCDEFFIAAIFKMITIKKNPHHYWWNGFKLGKRVQATSPNLPFFTPLFWAFVVNSAPFVHREARKVKNHSQKEINDKLSHFLFSKLEKMPNLYGDEISFADLAFFSQIELLKEFKFTYFDEALDNELIRQWYLNIEKRIKHSS